MGKPPWAVGVKRLQENMMTPCHARADQRLPNGWLWGYRKNSVFRTRVTAALLMLLLCAVVNESVSVAQASEMSEDLDDDDMGDGVNDQRFTEAEGFATVSMGESRFNGDWSQLPNCTVYAPEDVSKCPENTHCIITSNTIPRTGACSPKIEGMVCQAKDGMMYAANMGVHFPAGDDGCNMCTCAPSPAIGYEAMLICGTKTCPSCPVEKPATRCTHDPCLNTQCPLYPRATCSINNCGKCSASFEVDGRKVDCFKAPDPFLVASGFVDKEFKKCTMEPDGSSNCTEGICVVNSNDVPRQGICILPLQSQVCLGKDGTFYAAGLGVHFPAGDGCNFCTCEPPGGAGLPAIMQCSTRPCAICPPEKPPTQCLVDPCLDQPKCDLFPEAECMPYNCGECTRMFFVNSERVDCHNANSILKCKDSSKAKNCGNPCMEECLAYPDAFCEVDYCECSARYYFEGQEVDCKIQPPPNVESICRPGVEYAQCPINPCLVERCLAFPNATCKPNYCGGCQAVFTIDDAEVSCTEGDAETDTGTAKVQSVVISSEPELGLELDCNCVVDKNETESQTVCGADGKNYTSACFARCVGFSFNAGPCVGGECKPDCATRCIGDDGCGGFCKAPQGNDCTDCCLQDSVFRSTYAPGGGLPECYQWCLSRSDSFFGYLSHTGLPLPKGVSIPGETVPPPPDKSSSQAESFGIAENGWKK